MRTPNIKPKTHLIGDPLYYEFDFFLKLRLTVTTITALMIEKMHAYFI